MKRIDRSNPVREFHQARWNEPIIFELSKKGERGVLIPKVDEEIEKQVGNGLSSIPASMQRKAKLNLPELNQDRVVRHYTRLSQETLGSDLNIEIGQGTCTVKYSPKIHEKIARTANVAKLHPEQDPETVQGMLEVIYLAEQYMKEVSGMSRVSFQAGGGSQAAFSMASMVHAFHKANGEEEQRDEIITTIYSHPSDAAAPAVLGYKIIYIHPDEEGYPDLEAFKEAVGPKTAAFFVANPEDTGVYNKRILEFTKLAHDNGALACYDQANANGLLAVTRAKEAGFDMCFFNLHKTFSTPHGCGGPGAGAFGVVDRLIPFLPAPMVDKEGDKYVLNSDFKHSIGKVRSFLGVAPSILKAYAWMASLGAEGLYEVAKVAVLNNNYLFNKLMELDYVDAPYIKGKQRIEQARYSLEKLFKETGVPASDIQRRTVDFGIHCWGSHHPHYIAEPMTLEPTEKPSRDDLDEYIAILKTVFEEAYNNPEIFKNAPYNTTIHQVDESNMDDPEKWAITWRSYLKKYK